MIDIDIVDSVVQKVSDGFPIIITTSNGWIITSESDFRASGSLPEAGTLSSEDPKTVDILKHALTGERIAAVEITGGRLYLEFGGSIELMVEPDPDFESWNIVGPRKERIVCMAGGELAFWSAD
ncbi:DUF6188 family protein [Glycomyces sp. L485]|uniref:DUF6188 family protein n=1 Tax=Glycomyces sp. L485 TaxID=2909235 RepID=UPI001F4B2503|nr:DUF6188 family protein [Glycomyces sp. L485]MCH7231087.1 DUF6188 family protein [Glycomyces sp. L485]